MWLWKEKSRSKTRAAGRWNVPAECRDLHTKARLRAQLLEHVGSKFSQAGADWWCRWLLWAEKHGAEHSPAGAHGRTDLHPWRSKQEHAGFLLCTVIDFCLWFSPQHHPSLQAVSPTSAGAAAVAVLLLDAFEHKLHFGAEVPKQQCCSLWPVLGSPCPAWGQTHLTTSGDGASFTCGVWRLASP